MTAYGTVGRLPAAAGLDRRAPPGGAQPGAGHQRLDAGRRLPVRRAGASRVTRSSSSAPPTTARCSRCAPAAPTCGWSSSSPTGSTPRPSSGCSPPGREPKLAHIIPNFQNPAGYTLSAAKRERLLELAREHDFTIFEDDPYVSLRFEGESLPTMLSMDPERIVYASSFSKTVCPGIRVGYLVGSEELIARIAKLATNTYISPEHGLAGRSSTSSAARAPSSARSRRSARRCASAPRRCATRSPSSSPTRTFVAPEGGYFLWVDLPRGTDVAALHKAAAERGVQFVKGSDFLLEGGDSSLRLAYSGVTPAQIEDGVGAARRSLRGDRRRRPMRSEEVRALGALAGGAAAGHRQPGAGRPRQRRRSACSVCSGRRRGRDPRDP